MDSLRQVLRSRARHSTVNPVSITSDLSDYHAWLGDAPGRSTDSGGPTNSRPPMATRGDSVADFAYEPQR